MTSATPGPYEAEDTTVFVLEQDGWRAGKPVFVNRWSANVQGNRATHEEKQAVARLLAAAPAMLLALQDIVTAYENGGMIEPINRAIDAIAKATGESA